MYDKKNEYEAELYRLKSNAETLDELQKKGIAIRQHGLKGGGVVLMSNTKIEQNDDNTIVLAPKK